MLKNWFEELFLIKQEDYFKISKLRFTSTDSPDLHDIVFILDKPSSTPRFGIGRISGWDESSDGEKRIFHVEMSRPSVKSHPYPLQERTTTPRLFKRSAVQILYSANMKNENLYLLYKENQNNNLAVKTSYGISTRFMVEDIIMQGTVFAPLQATTSMSQLGSSAYKSGKPLLTYKDTVEIPALGMIDDIATVNKCGVDAVISNSVTNSFVESKRLELGSNKSHRLHFEKKKKECLNLKMHDKQMNSSNKENYVGDIVTEDGKNNENIESRRSKAFGIAGEILAILDKVPLGPYRIDAGLVRP